MRYMFLVYSQERPDGLSQEESDGVRATHGSVMQDAAARGILRAVDKLKPTTTATTVRAQAGGVTATTDGPFAETKEQLAGYYILECQDLDEAIEWAKRIPTECRGGGGCIEIRPIEEFT